VGLIAIGSVRGSPGATSAALALASRWPRPGALVVEADPGGGVLAARFGHRCSPGLVEWASDTRRAQHSPLEALASSLGAADTVGRYVQRIDGLTTDVVLGPDPAQMEQALHLLAGGGVVGAVAEHRALLLDIGRIDWHSAALPLACAADTLLLVTSGWPDAVDAIAVRRERLLSLPGMRAQVALVLVGDLPYPPGEVASTLALPVAGHLPADPRAADVLAGGLEPRKASPGRRFCARRAPSRNNWTSPTLRCSQARGLNLPPRNDRRERTRGHQGLPDRTGLTLNGLTSNGLTSRSRWRFLSRGAICRERPERTSGRSARQDRARPEGCALGTGVG
jgi:hypothetical protein